MNNLNKLIHRKMYSENDNEELLSDLERHLPKINNFSQ